MYDGNLETSGATSSNKIGIMTTLGFLWHLYIEMDPGPFPGHIRHLRLVLAKLMGNQYIGLQHEKYQYKTGAWVTKKFPC